MTIKYQIFISSTYDDLRSERDQVMKAVLEMGHIPVGMEMFSAADEEQWKIIQRHIDQADYYIVVLAHRYGSERRSNGVLPQVDERLAIQIKYQEQACAFVVETARR